MTAELIGTRDCSAKMPLLARIDFDDKSVQAIVLTPPGTVDGDCRTGLATPPTARFWMLGVLDPRIVTTLLAMRW